MWPRENVHNLFACRISGCFCSSRKEQERLWVAEDAKKKENKKPDKYKHERMLNPHYWSICYVGNHGFFCVLCKKHNMKNAQNKSQTFIESLSKRLKEDSLKTHMALTVHSSAIQAELLQPMSVFHQNYVEKNEVQTTVLQNVFATAFFLMKEFIANRKLISLISFMEKVLGISQLKHFSHRSQGSVREIYLTLGDTVKQTLLKKARKAKLWVADGWSYRHNSVLPADLIYPVLGPRKLIRYNNVPVFSECARRLCKLQLRSHYRAC